MEERLRFNTYLPIPRYPSHTGAFVFTAAPYYRCLAFVSPHMPTFLTTPRPLDAYWSGVLKNITLVRTLWWMVVIGSGCDEEGRITRIYCYTYAICTRMLPHRLLPVPHGSAPIN